MIAVLQDKVHPQTIAVLQSRADGLGLTVEVGDEASFNVDKDVSGVLVQYPATDGSVHDYKVRSVITAAFDVSQTHGICAIRLEIAVNQHNCCCFDTSPKPFHTAALSIQQCLLMLSTIDLPMPTRSKSAQLHQTHTVKRLTNGLGHQLSHHIYLAHIHVQYHFSLQQ